MFKYLLLLTVSALSIAAHAQDTGEDSTEDALAEIIAAQDEAAPETDQPVEWVVLSHERRVPITVTADGLGTSITDTGQAVTVIDREEIEAVQGADPLRVLRRVPGVTASRSGGAGSLTGLSVRGSSPEQVLVLVDGVRVADPSSPSGGFDFGNLLTGTSSKFDILRGSNSTIFGSDALGGVIDISTRAETGLEGSVEFGARDTLFATTAAGIDEGGLYFGLTGSWYDTKGFSAARDGEEADGFEQFALGAVTFVDITDSIEAFAHANFSEGYLDIDGFSFSPPFGLVDSGDTQKTTRHWGDVGLAYQGNDLTLRGSYSLSDTERQNRTGEGIESFASDGTIERLALRGDYLLIGGLALAFGAEHEWSRFETSFDAPQKTSTTGGYAQLGWELGDLAVHLGARHDAPEDFRNETSFGGDISYVFGDGWRLRASVGEGYKAPTLFQLFSDYGNPSLAPESSTSFDLGIEKGQRDSRFRLALTAFRRDSENLIGFASCAPGEDAPICAERPFGFYANTGRARAQGIEVEAGHSLTDALYVAGVYSLVDTEDRNTGNWLARRPRHSGTLFADWESDFGFNLGADLRIVGDSYDDAGNLTRLDGYEVVDLRASQDIGDNLTLFGRVENVFDADYETVAGYGTPGRGAFIGLRAQM